MSTYGSEVLSKLRVVISKLFVSLWTICCLVFILMYQHYNHKAAEKKQQIMQNYYDMILEVTLNKINYLAAKKSVNLQAGDSMVEIDNKSIKICQETKCFYYDLFTLCASINKIVPEFINYKISLNKSNLYVNSKTQNYEIEKIHHITNSIQLATTLGIDQTFWKNKEFNIKKRFYLLSLAVVAILLLFCLLLQIILRYSNKLYDARHHKILEQLKIEYQQQLKDRETLLMEKIWNINFNKQKDTEINYLFAQKANQVVYGNQDELKNLTKHVPYKIILYQQDHQEKVDVDKLVDTFISRFSGEAQNISINVSSSLQALYFSSQAALYQIIYSIINYLFFLLKQSSFTEQYQVNLCILVIRKRLKLCFTYNGILINDEKDLLSMSNEFLRFYVNPFLLSINQVFNILRTNHFSCKVSNNKIEIIEMNARYGAKKDNVISILRGKKK